MCLPLIGADSLRVRLEAKRIVALKLADDIFNILDRANIKALSKPGAAVVRVLMAERGLSTFTANRLWGEFKALCTRN